MPMVGFDPGTFRLRSERVTTELTSLMSVDWRKVNPIFTCAFFLLIYMQHMIDVAK